MVSLSKTIISLSDNEIDVLIDKVINDNPDPVRDYRSGKTQALSVLIGKVVKVTPGIDKAFLVDRLKSKLAQMNDQNRRRPPLPEEILRVELKFLINQNIRLKEAVDNLERENKDLLDQIKFLKTDQKSGVLREDVADEEIEGIMSLCQKLSVPLTIMASDINSFKALQDTRSHTWGDHAIQAAARALQGQMRPTDLILRKSAAGDEFTILMPGLAEADAQMIRDRLEERTSSIDVDDGTYTGKISLTVGCATAHEVNYQNVYELADKNLLERKRARKVNR